MQTFESQVIRLDAYLCVEAALGSCLGPGACVVRVSVPCARLFHAVNRSKLGVSEFVVCVTQFELLTGIFTLSQNSNKLWTTHNRSQSVEFLVHQLFDFVEGFLKRAHLGTALVLIPVDVVRLDVFRFDPCTGTSKGSISVASPNRGLCTTSLCS
jgi:hypothetical protein